MQVKRNSGILKNATEVKSDGNSITFVYVYDGTGWSVVLSDESKRYTHSYIHTCIHTHIYSYNLYTYIHTYTNTYTHTYMHTYMHRYLLTVTQYGQSIPPNKVYANERRA